MSSLPVVLKMRLDVEIQPEDQALMQDLKELCPARTPLNDQVKQLLFFCAEHRLQPLQLQEAFIRLQEQEHLMQRFAEFLNSEAAIKFISDHSFVPKRTEHTAEEQNLLQTVQTVKDELSASSRTDKTALKEPLGSRAASAEEDLDDDGLEVNLGVRFNELADLQKKQEQQREAERRAAIAKTIKEAEQNDKRSDDDDLNDESEDHDDLDGWGAAMVNADQEPSQHNESIPAVQPAEQEEKAKADLSSLPPQPHSSGAANPRDDVQPSAGADAQSVNAASLNNPLGSIASKAQQPKLSEEQILQDYQQRYSLKSDASDEQPQSDEKLGAAFDALSADDEIDKNELAALARMKQSGLSPEQAAAEAAEFST